MKRLFGHFGLLPGLDYGFLCQFDHDSPILDAVLAGDLLPPPAVTRTLLGSALAADLPGPLALGWFSQRFRLPLLRPRRKTLSGRA